jgi:hypothetical protein
MDSSACCKVKDKYYKLVEFDFRGKYQSKRIETCHSIIRSIQSPSWSALEANPGLHGDRVELCHDLGKTTVELVYVSGRRSLSLLLLCTSKMTYVHSKFRGMLLGNR